MFYIHTLRNGTTVAITSLHGGKFSDSTQCRGSPKEDVDKLTCQPYEFPVNGLENVVISKFVLTPDIMSSLDELVNNSEDEITKCPKCNADVVGTTYLHEVDSDVYQCENGHMILPPANRQQMPSHS